MKAAIVEGKGVLRIRDIPVPQAGDYEALCHILYGAICAGTDTHIVDGVFPWIGKLPTVLGHESIGRVIQIGAAVRSFRVGDLVTRVGTKAAKDGSFSVTWGGFAEYGVAEDHVAMQTDGVPLAQPWSAGIHQVVPADISPAAAPMIITWRETLSYVTRMGLPQARSVLVIGSGGNGLAFIAHAKHLGVARIACIGAGTRAATTCRAGATEYYDYRTAGPAGDFDFIIDAVGKTGSLDKYLPLLAPGGTLGLYGLDDIGNCPVNPSRARGSFTFYNGGYSEAEAHERVIALIRSGQLDARLWFDLDRPYRLAHIHDAFAAIRQRQTIKALIQMPDPPAV